MGNVARTHCHIRMPARIRHTSPTTWSLYIRDACGARRMQRRDHCACAPAAQPTPTIPPTSGASAPTMEQQSAPQRLIPIDAQGKPVDQGFSISYNATNAGFSLNLLTLPGQPAPWPGGEWEAAHQGDFNKAVECAPPRYSLTGIRRSQPSRNRGKKLSGLYGCSASRS